MFTYMVGSPRSRALKILLSMLAVLTPRATEQCVDLTAEPEINDEYPVRSATNILGWNIPLEFYLLQYIRGPWPKTNAWQLHLSAKGKVTSVRITEDFPAMTGVP
jgi:hypothetical protein